MKRDEIKTKFHDILIQWLEEEGDGWKLLDKAMEAAGLSIEEAGDETTVSILAVQLDEARAELEKVKGERDKLREALEIAREKAGMCVDCGDTPHGDYTICQNCATKRTAALNPTTETMADSDPDRFSVHPGKAALKNGGG